jgi:hypothetical protein
MLATMRERKKCVGTVLPEREIVDTGSLPLNAQSSRLGNTVSFPFHPSPSSLHQGQYLGEKCRLSVMMRHIEGSMVDGRVKAKEDTIEGGVSEVVQSSSSAVATGHSRPLALAGLLSPGRREDTVTARGRLFVHGQCDKEAMLPALMLLP